MQLGLFPLPLFLLPGGITKLRIFEPRYVRLVKESMVDNKGFVLAMKEGEELCVYGTRVEIIDFDSLPDGLLGITLRAVSRVKIIGSFQQEDGLWVGHVESIPNWSEKTEHAGFIGDALESLFKAHPEHASQYSAEVNFQNMLWACQRWLEVLPLATPQRQWFMSQNDLSEAKHFIALLLKEER